MEDIQAIRAPFRNDHQMTWLRGCVESSPLTAAKDSASSQYLCASDITIRKRGRCRVRSSLDWDLCSHMKLSLSDQEGHRTSQSFAMNVAQPWRARPKPR